MARALSRTARTEEEPVEETPRRGRSRSEASSEGPKDRGTVSEGWGGVAKNQKDSGSFPTDFKVGDEEVLFRFLESEPFTSYRQHWFNELQGKKSFVCLGDDCPLCDEIGDRPSTVAAFNVLDLTDPDDPTVKVWRAGVRVTSLIKKRADNPKTSPLDDPNHYFVVSKSREGNKGPFNFSLEHVKVRDLEEDWEMAPLTADELEIHTEDRFDSSIVYVNTRRELKEIAEQLDA